jgi:hypothetical protein
VANNCRSREARHLGCIDGGNGLADYVGCLGPTAAKGQCNVVLSDAGFFSDNGSCAISNGFAFESSSGFMLSA